MWAEQANQILNICMIALGIFFVTFGSNLIINFFASLIKKSQIPHSNKFTKFAVIVPARNEADVIDHICASLIKQTYPVDYFDVYFIVESKNDPTIAKIKKYAFRYFVRNNLTPDRRTKGFAIQELIQHFKDSGLYYDAYMIFDADNILSPNYIEKMNDLRQTGVEVGCGFRSFTNASENVLTLTSSYLFLQIMSVTGQARSLLYRKFPLSGTGYYVNSKIIEEAGGWIFTGMTEDTELTAYCYKNDINMRLLSTAIFYDEQSPVFRVWHNQHTRWAWGYFSENKKEVVKKGKKHYNLTPMRLKMAKIEYTVSFIPFAVLMAGFYLIMIASTVLGIIASVQGLEFDVVFYYKALYIFIGIIFGCALLATYYTIVNFRKVRFGWLSIIGIFTYWFLFIDIVFAFLDGLFDKSKRTTWKKIPHNGKITNKKVENYR